MTVMMEIVLIDRIMRNRHDIMKRIKIIFFSGYALGYYEAHS